MSLFGKIFGKKSEVTKSPVEAAQPIDPSQNKDLIQVYDQYGSKMFITREQWRTNILPETIQSNWNIPDQLYQIIVTSLNDGFRSDIVKAAEQLYKIDTIPARAACIWGIVLTEEERLDEAEKVFHNFIAHHGEEGVILTNLAKVYSKRKNDSKSEEILWHALEKDPNQDNGMGWYEAIYRERGGEEAGQEALRRIAAIPGSWRAQIWLARTSLKSRHLEQALAYYNESLSRMSKPVPSDCLMQISGDLGNYGHLPELLNIVEPLFDISFHGLQVGNNLIKAHLDLGQIDAARQILDQLYALKRPDWKETLSFWDTEITKTGIAATPLEQKEPLKMAMLTIEGPVWLNHPSPFIGLFPKKSHNEISVAFLGCSAEVASNSKRVQRQMADAPGRMSRALPLYLAEQLQFSSQARVQTFVPWIVTEVGGFVLSGSLWKDEDAAHYAQQSESKSDYIVTTHLKTQTEPWTIELRLIRTIDAKCLSNLTASFDSSKPEQAIPDLARELTSLVVEQTGVATQMIPPFYQVPSAPNFSYYLLRLEQLLAVRCAGMDDVNPGFLSGEREIIDGNLQLCLTCPDNITVRLLFIQTLLTMNKARPDVLTEFKDKVALLQNENPLSQPVQSMVQGILNQVFED